MQTSFPKDISLYKELIHKLIEHFHTPTRSACASLRDQLTHLVSLYPKEESILHLKENVEAFALSMEEHLQKEEDILFPLITAIDTTIDFTYKSSLIKPITKMEEEHVEHHHTINRLQASIAKVKNIDNPILIDILDKLTALITLTFEHIYVEDEILFKRIKGK